MRFVIISGLICTVILIGGCSSQSTNQSSPSATASSPTVNSATPNSATSATPVASSQVVKPSIDACTLLTSDEIKAVQGESLKDTKASDRASGDLIVTQCYYELPTASNSISLTLTETNPQKKGRSLKDVWEEAFGKDENKTDSERKREGEKERDKEKAKPAAGEEEEESAPLEPVRGVGDEAFWSASRVGGALYVLKRDRFIRISVGGKGDLEAKLKKSKALAQKALRHL